MEEADYLPIAHVAEVLYCPRNFYYRYMECAEDSNAHTLEGRYQDQRRDEREIIYRDEVIQTRRVMLVSERLRTAGWADTIEQGSALYPIEYKKGVLQNNPNDDVQLCLQAIALEEMLDINVERGYIYYAASHARREVIFAEDLRARAEWAVREAARLIEAKIIPEPLLDGRCRGCSLEPRCLPQEVSYINGFSRPPARPFPGINLGRVLYVDRAGAYVRSRGERFLVTCKDEQLADVPAVNLDELVLVGNSNMSNTALRLALDHSIPVSFLSGSGRFLGCVAPPFNKNVVLREAQHSLLADESFRLKLAGAVVRGKLANMRSLVMRHEREEKNHVLTEVIQQLRELMVRASDCADPTELLGIEGFATKIYFSVFNYLLKEETKFDFQNRYRRPPRDPVNAMLSFGYSLLAKSVAGAVQVAGLDPYVGFYHASKYGRPALALDLMEEFRPLVVDAVVITVINKRMVQPSDFETRFGGCFLTDSGRGVFYKAFESRLNETIKHPVFGYKLSYRRTIELQARFLAKVITGEISQYRSFTVR